MADISKIKLANGTTVTIKDAQGRADMTTILGGHALEALGAAAWKAVATEVSKSADLPTAEAVKSYVDSAVGKIHNFDVVIDADGSAATGPSVTASADTMYKIYLVPSGEAAAGEYIEYITIKSGDGETATFKWEAIGSTKTNLTGYVPTSTTIATIKLDHNITVAELQTALGLGAMAYAATASGSNTVDTIDSITMAPMTVAGNAAVTLADADATLTKANYKPSGTINSDAIKGGTVTVTLGDSATKTEADLGTTTFTPTGTIAAKDGGSFSALKTATLGEVTEGGIQVDGEISKPEISLTTADKTFATGLTGGSKASFTEGTFTPAAFEDGFYTAGVAASWTGRDYVAPTMGEATKAAFASEGVTAAIDAEDAECLTFTNAATAQAVTAQGAFDAGKVDFGIFNGGSATLIDTTKFSGGSKAADKFVANELQSVATDTVSEVSAAALANAPVFTGKRYSVSTTSDTALKDVAFTATNSATIVNKVEYVKPEVKSTAFDGEAATSTFAGTEVKDVLVTGVSYKKAAEAAAFSVDVTPAVAEDGLKKTAKTVNITVTPDA